MEAAGIEPMFQDDIDSFSTDKDFESLDSVAVWQRTCDSLGQLAMTQYDIDNITVANLWI